ncbi:hypothetical protein ACFE04_019511 [Oxalis oulophora]
MECLKLFDDEAMSRKRSLVCYCDVLALILSSTETNTTKRNLLVTCSKHNELGFRCNMCEWLYNETYEHDCKKILDMRREEYMLSLNHGPIPMSAYKGRVYNGYPLCLCNKFCKVAVIRHGLDAGGRFFACTYYDDEKDVEMCKLKVWFYPSTTSELVSTFNMETYRSWDDEKKAHKRAPSPALVRHLRLNEPSPTPVQQFGINDPSPTHVQNLRLNEPSPTHVQHFRLNEPSRTPLQLRVRPGRPAFKKMVASRSTWSDKNWSSEENVILEGVPFTKITELGL